MLLGKFGKIKSYKMHKAFWKDKKVLITGHTGFKGSWLSNILLNCGAKVFGYSLKPINQFDLYNLTKLKKNLKGRSNRRYFGFK